MKKIVSSVAAAALLVCALAFAGCAQSAASGSASASGSSSASASASSASASAESASAESASAESASAESASASAASASAESASAEAASASAASASAEAASASSAAADAKLANGTYEATFDTDSSMFHVNEAMNGKGTLTVTDDGMTIHVSLVSKKIVNLYAGTAADAENDSANWLQPTTDTVTYSDGKQGEVYGFDIPVPVIGEEFDVALLGEKGTWYDHKVIVSDPVAVE